MAVRTCVSAIFFVAFVVSNCASTPAAADCKPLARETSVELVHPDGDPRPLIPVTVRGQSKVMLVDTGGGSNMISTELADKLKLPRRKLEFDEFGLKGDKSNEGVSLDDFTIGRLHSKSMDFVVRKKLADDKNDSESYLDGIIGPAILRHYDLDIDFGTDRLSLLSPDHCEGKVIYWPASAVAVIPARILKLGHVLMTTQLDGHEITALLDTGADTTVLKLPVAQSEFGLTPGAADTPKAGELIPGQTTYHHRFKSLNLNGIAISNLDIQLLPDLTFSERDVQPPTGSMLPIAELRDDVPGLIVGVDVLRHLHIYVAYNEQKIYVTPAGSPPENANKTGDGSPRPSSGQSQ